MIASVNVTPGEVIIGGKPYPTSETNLSIERAISDGVVLRIYATPITRWQRLRRKMAW